VDMEGELRIDVCLTGTAFAVDRSPFSITPNSFMDNPVGEGLADDVASPPTLTLVRRVPTVDPEVFNGGDPAAEVRLEIRGILVGVSFSCPATEFISDGGSLESFKICELLVPFRPTDGDPAIVGNRLRVRREESDCLCIELTVCVVSLEVDEAVREIEGAAPDEDVDEEGFNRATRCAVAGSKADICIGGRLIGDFGFRGSVEDSV
jgi:hypothetical protein